MSIDTINGGRAMYPAAPRPVSSAGPAGAASPGRAGGPKSADVYQQLEDYVKMSPAQRMREELLKKLGLTEEELAAKSPEEQKAIEAKLSEMVQQEMQKAQAAHKAGGPKLGQFLDTVA